MELWEMTFKQFCENWLNNSRYKDKYKKDATRWNNKKRDLQLQWISILEERAEEGTIPEKVIRSFVNMFGEEQTRRTFRGVKEKGLELWNQTQTKKALRENIIENLRKCAANK